MLQLFFVDLRGQLDIIQIDINLVIYVKKLNINLELSNNIRLGQVIYIQQLW